MDKIIKIMKKIKIRNILVLIVLFAFNAYAWFIYTTKVSMDLTDHVSAWDVEFVSGQGGITSDVAVVVERIYPGMEPFERVIQVNNKGEVTANLRYEVRSARIIDEYYEVGQINPATSQEYTPTDIENILKNNYPFEVTIDIDETDFGVVDGIGYYTITVSWDFESGDDELDTLWGSKAYEFYENHPGEEAVEINILLIATQSAS